MGRSRTPAAEATEDDTLYGSGVLPALVDVGDPAGEVQLGEIVARSHKESGLSVADWNALPETERDVKLQATVDAMRFENSGADTLRGDAPFKTSDDTLTGDLLADVAPPEADTVAGAAPAPDAPPPVPDPMPSAAASLEDPGPAVPEGVTLTPPAGDPQSPAEVAQAAAAAQLAEGVRLAVQAHERPLSTEFLASTLGEKEENVVAAADASDLLVLANGSVSLNTGGTVAGFATPPPATDGAQIAAGFTPMAITGSNAGGIRTDPFGRDVEYFLDRLMARFSEERLKDDA